MEILYRSKQAILYGGDSKEVIPTLEECHLLLADPAYEVAFRSNRRTKPFPMIHGDDGLQDTERLLDLAVRKLARGRHLYVFGPADLSKLPVSNPVELVWDKDYTGMGDLTLPWGPAHERLRFATHELSKANREKGYGSLAARMRKGSVLHVPRVQGGATGRHPNEKPVLLYRQLIESSSVIGETVLDPFCGSGSSLVAAILEGRKAVGIEIDERWWDTAVQRIKDARSIAKKMNRI